MKRTFNPFFATITVMAGISASASADQTRNAGADNLNLGTAWSSGTAPVSGDIAIWDANSTLANTLGANLVWGGLNISAASGAVSLSGTNTLNAGAINTGSNNLSVTTSTANNSFQFTGLAGSGTVTLNNGTSNNSVTGLNSANALNFTGTLVLRGGNATTAPGTVGGSWFALSGANLTQAAGTAFALDTGASATNAKDLILGDGFNGKTLSLSSLTGYGAIRNDWGGAAGTTVVRTVNVTQATDSTFNGLILSSASSANPNAIRAVNFVKDGAGILTLAGIVGKQTASAGGSASPVGIEVKGGTLVMTANNTTTGTLTVRSGALLRMENANAGTGFTGGNSSMTGSYTVDAGGELRAYRNGTAAFGTGSIILNGGQLTATSGNWTWTNAITLNGGTSSSIAMPAGDSRYLKLQGIVSSTSTTGNVTFLSSGSTTGLADRGYILTGSNTMSGVVTINSGAYVRVGGVTGDSIDLAAGTGGTLGTASVTNNGILLFSRSDSHAVGNDISGTGAVRIGSSGITGSNSQIVTFSGANRVPGSS